MAKEVLKVKHVLSLFFCCCLWISESAVPQEPVLTTAQSQGHFCYTVKNSNSSKPGSPATVPIDELILWHSTPKLSLFMLVNVTVGDVYEAATGTVMLGAEQLSEGAHDLSYALTVGEEEQFYLSVLVDGQLVPPENSSVAYHQQDSSFISVTISGRGPIIYRWNQTCADPTLPPEEAATSVSGHKSVEADASQDEIQDPSQSKAVTVVLWIFIGIGSAGLLLLVIVGLALFIQKTAKSRHTHLVRTVEAERQKQTITNEAQRLSYIEQIKWTADDQGGETSVRLMSST